MLRQTAKLALNALKGGSVSVAEAGSQQVRRMAGGENLVHRTYNGKPVPRELQGPDYVTYGGATISKKAVKGTPFEHYLSTVIGAATTFTCLYHFYHNAEEHWYGDIYFFEKDVQQNGWDDENNAVGHAHGHGHAHH